MVIWFQLSKNFFFAIKCNTSKIGSPRKFFSIGINLYWTGVDKMLPLQVKVFGPHFCSRAIQVWGSTIGQKRFYASTNQRFIQSVWSLTFAFSFREIDGNLYFEFHRAEHGGICWSKIPVCTRFCQSKDCAHEIFIFYVLLCQNGQRIIIKILRAYLHVLNSKKRHSINLKFRLFRYRAV